jgi:Tfp pilus assembly protein PilX
MKNLKSILSNQTGAAIVLVLLMVAVAIIIGVTAISTSNTELQIATQDVRHKTAFYAADGGTEYGAELVEQNIACPGGFSITTVGNIEVGNATLWMNATATKPTDTNRDFYFPTGYSAGEPHTNLTVGGVTALAEGGAIQMAAGYEGKGKGAPSGGAHIVYDINAEHLGRFNSKSLVLLQWRHVIGQEGTCLY